MRLIFSGQWVTGGYCRWGEKMEARKRKEGERAWRVKIDFGLFCNYINFKNLTT